MKKTGWLPLLVVSIFFTVFFVLGFLFGSYYSVFEDNAKGVSILENNKDIKVPVIMFEKIENGMLYGEISHGQVRIKVQEEDIQVFNTREFQFSVVDILPMLKKIPAPEGMQFVASSRGKTFYALDDPRASLVSVKNRVFFVTEKEAIEAGYKKFQ